MGFVQLHHWILPGLGEVLRSLQELQLRVLRCWGEVVSCWLVGWLVGWVGLGWVGLDWVGLDWIGLVGWLVLFCFALFCCWWIFLNQLFFSQTLKFTIVFEVFEWSKIVPKRLVTGWWVEGPWSIWIMNSASLYTHISFVTNYLQHICSLQFGFIVLAWAVMARSPLFKVSCSSELSSLQTHFSWRVKDEKTHRKTIKG